MREKFKRWMKHPTAFFLIGILLIVICALFFAGDSAYMHDRLNLKDSQIIRKGSVVMGVFAYALQAVAWLFILLGAHSLRAMPDGRGIKALPKWARIALACVGVAVLYVFYTGVLPLIMGWKHGGGMIPFLAFMATAGAIWIAIVGKGKPSENVPDDERKIEKSTHWMRQVSTSRRKTDARQEKKPHGGFPKWLLWIFAAVLLISGVVAVLLMSSSDKGDVETTKEVRHGKEERNNVRDAGNKSRKDKVNTDSFLGVRFGEEVDPRVTVCSVFGWPKVGTRTSMQIKPRERLEGFSSCDVSFTPKSHHVVQVSVSAELPTYKALENLTDRVKRQLGEKYHGTFIENRQHEVIVCYRMTVGDLRIDITKLGVEGGRKFACTVAADSIEWNEMMIREGKEMSDSASSFNGLFGYEFGMDCSLPMSERIANGVIEVHPFSPQKTFGDFTEYQILTSPGSRKIWGVRAWSYPSVSRAREIAERTMNLIERKFGQCFYLCELDAKKGFCRWQMPIGWRIGTGDAMGHSTNRSIDLTMDCGGSDGNAILLLDASDDGLLERLRGGNSSQDQKDMEAL